MKVRYSPRTISDLAGIADYLIKHGPRGARSVDRSIQKAIDLIAAFPGSGRILEQRPTIRIMPVGRHPYLVFYTLREKEIDIRHSARAPIDPAGL